MLHKLKKNPYAVKMALMLCGYIFFAGFTYAQSINFNFKAPSSAPSAPVAAPASAPANQVMAPDDFQNRVNNLGKQNLNNLSQQVTQQQTVKPAASLPNNKLSTPIPNQNSTAVPPTPLASPKPSMPVMPAPAAQPAQNQVYTGFNFDNTNTGTINSSPSTNSGGGWNIKY